MLIELNERNKTWAHKEDKRNPFLGIFDLWWFFNGKKSVREMINSLELSPCVCRVMNCYQAKENNIVIIYCNPDNVL